MSILLIDDGIFEGKLHKAYVYSGQTFKIPVMLYGQWNGSVPGIVHSELVNKSRSAHFAPLQETQYIEHSCTNLTYTIFYTEYFEVMQLKVNGVQYYETKTQVLIISHSFHVLLASNYPRSLHKRKSV